VKYARPVPHRESIPRGTDILAPPNTPSTKKHNHPSFSSHIPSQRDRKDALKSKDLREKDNRKGKKQNTWSGYEFFRHRKIPSLSSYKIEPTSNERIIKSLTMPCFDYIPPKNSP
jgi:hypothetical protein